MECPRCGGRLTRYRLDERQAVGCQECAYVGVSVDHTADNGRPESWDDALDRFQERGQSVERVTHEDRPVELPAAEPTEGSPGEGVARELADDEELVLPVFDEAETNASQEDAESADGTPSAESADAGD